MQASAEEEGETEAEVEAEEEPAAGEVAVCANIDGSLPCFCAIHTDDTPREEAGVETEDEGEEKPDEDVKVDDGERVGGWITGPAWTNVSLCKSVSSTDGPLRDCADTCVPFICNPRF